MTANYIKTAAVAITLTAVTPFAFADPAVDKTAEAEAVIPAEQEGTLAKLINDSATFSILTTALKATGLDKTLAGKDNYTVFAPTDEAFSKLPEGALTALFLPANEEKLRSLLLYHVVPGVVMSGDLTDTEVKTMNGEKVDVDVDGTEIEINDSKVYSKDVLASNGVMHALGEVLVPDSLDGFEGLDN